MSHSDISEKAFLKQLSILSGELQRSIDAKKLGLDTSPEARAERRRRVLHEGDFQFFAYTYFPHHIFGEPSHFQRHFCERLPMLLRDKPEGCMEWWVAPRGEAKSSLLTKIAPVFIAAQELLQKPDIRAEMGWFNEPPSSLDYIVFLGAETKLPTKLLAVVKTELTCNANLQMDFPEICGQSSNWKVGEFTTVNGVKMEPFGAEQAIRGTFHGASRPKVLMGDDLITDKEAKSATERQNRWDWLEKATEYLGPPDGSVKYLGVGTILNDDDPISRAKRTVGHLVHHFKAIVQLPKNMDLWEQCAELMLNDDRVAEQRAAKNNKPFGISDQPSYQFYIKHKKQMDKGAVVSWPAVRSLYKLMFQRTKSPKAFGTEMQGEARNDDDKIFTNIRYWVMKKRHWLYFGACDPSMGKNEKSDPSAILWGAYDAEDQILNVVEAEIKRRATSKLMSDLIKGQREYNAQAIGFENNNAFEYMRTQFMTNGLAKSVALPLVGVTAIEDPRVRIDSLEPYITDPIARILFQTHQHQLLDEMNTWPENQTHHHYDGLTALHILWMIAVSRATSLKDSVATAGERGHKNNYAGYD